MSRNNITSSCIFLPIIEACVRLRPRCKVLTQRLEVGIPSELLFPHNGRFNGTTHSKYFLETLHIISETTWSKPGINPANKIVYYAVSFEGALNVGPQYRCTAWVMTAWRPYQAHSITFNLLHSFASFAEARNRNPAALPVPSEH